MPEVVSDRDPVVIGCLLMLMVSAHGWEVGHEKKKGSVNDFVLLIIFMLLILVVAE
jgi:hypothetical protein